MTKQQLQGRPVKMFACLFQTGETLINVIDFLEAILDLMCAQSLGHA